jgi:uncharacterized repeat protein (TIGR02543 family)
MGPKHFALLVALLLGAALAGCGEIAGGSTATNYTLTVQISGDGSTSPVGTSSHASGTVVQVTATPEAGWIFTGWSGAATGTTNPLSITMDGNKTLTATFSLATVTNYTLTISVSGSGTTSPAAGTHSYASGSTVQVTATPASGYVFAGWSGAATGTTNPLSITMDGNKTLTATFNASADSDTTPSGGCGKARTLQNGTITIQSNGTSRTYILRVPDNYDNTHPYRLVVAYHWLGGTAQDVAGTYGWYGLWDLANKSTIFVAPQGLQSGGTTGWPNTGGQDVAFTDALLAQIEGDLCIDTSRIFANGFSYGAGMSYAIACARAQVFRGVALYSGGLISGCSGGTTPIAYFQAHGLGDPVLTISGARSLRDRFVSVNGCTPQNPPEPTTGSGTHMCTAYQGCSAGHPLVWCAFDGGHTPSPRDSGQSTGWLPQPVWDFIKQF